MSIADLRKEYSTRRFGEADAAGSPFEQFQRWFAEAVSTASHEPNAMTLATATADGRPSARIVLLKGFDSRGFVFFTNYASRKGRELAANPWASLVFYWPELERQVRIDGCCTLVAAEESDDYFRQRPRGSQLGALASPQSTVIPGREWLEQRIGELEAEYGERTISRPDYWGGYRLSPVEFEFWQGRLSRLHDRLRYRLLDDGSWVLERLSP